MFLFLGGFAIMFKFRREVDVTWRAIRSDYNTTLIPITIDFLFSASRAQNNLFPPILVGPLFAILYIVPFCLPIN